MSITPLAISASHQRYHITQQLAITSWARNQFLWDSDNPALMIKR